MKIKLLGQILSKIYSFRFFLPSCWAGHSLWPLRQLSQVESNSWQSSNSKQASSAESYVKYKQSSFCMQRSMQELPSSELDTLTTMPSQSPGTQQGRSEIYCLLWFYTCTTKGHVLRTCNEYFSSYFNTNYYNKDLITDALLCYF